MMKMEIKFFDGSLAQIEKEFNAWSKGKYIQQNTLHLKRGKGGETDGGILQVTYGVKS